MLFLVLLFWNLTAFTQQFLTTIAGWNAYVHLPDDYNSNPQLKYPLIVFWPGVDEVGTDPTKLLIHGPSKFINDGWNGHVTVNGKTEKPIIISVQPTTAWPVIPLVNTRLDSIILRWRVDVNRMYFTGLSHGGWITNSFVNHSVDYSKKLAATVGMSAVLPVNPYSQYKWYAEAGGKTWQFEGNSDLRGNNKITDTMNKYVPGSGRYTLYSGGHCCWNTFYNPSWTENGQSVYQFLLSNSKSLTVANAAPVANAGSDITIKLPANSVSLTGSGSDIDGSVASYSWTKLSSLAGTINSPSSASTSITGLEQGTHLFRLTITDNAGATATDDVHVTVNGANSCNGKRYNLTPGPYYINLAGKVAAGDTIVIAAGNYAFIELSGLDGTQECPITIINQGGQVVFEAFNIAFPSHHVRLTGTGAAGVPYGFKMRNVATNYWGMHLKAEGPIEIDHVEITNCAMGIQLKDDYPPAGMTEHRGYKLHNLYIHDINGNEGMYIGSSTTPTAPKVKGVHIYDVLISNTSREGLQISNAQDVLVERVKILKPSMANTPSQNHAFNMGHDVQGTARNMYVQSAPSYNVFISGGRINFECSTIDNTYTTFPTTLALFGKNYEFDASSWVEPYQQFNIRNILLKNAGGVNIASLAAEGPLLPNTVENVKIEGGVTTPMSWGPSAAVSNVGTNVTFSGGCTPPTLETMWTPNWPATSPGDGNPPPPVNKPPVANAGSNLVITLPVNSVTLNGSGTDADGSVTNYSWTRLSGPATFTISNPSSAQTSITNLVQGTYVFQLQVTDDKGATGISSVQVIVNPAAPPPNKAPSVNAGTDINITLPVNNAELRGSASDADGSIAGFLWSQLSGPSASSIANRSSAQTIANGLVQGVYYFQLQAEDNSGSTAADTVMITVSAAPPTNQIPIANAGSDLTITLPVNSAALNGAGSDPDGSISTYAWAQLSGPSTAGINSASNAQTQVTNLVQGLYQFQLTVTDNSGATASDVVNVTVNPAVPSNKPPVANAGNDIAITLPVNNAALNGAGSDSDGSISTYAWSQLSGPSTAGITSASNAQTQVTNLVQGLYQFQLTVTDNSGATASDVVNVTVNPAVPSNKPPVANAGNDIAITLPVNNAALNGAGSDSDGSISTYAWSQLSGPSTAGITSASNAQTQVTNLVQGLYQFQLTVTDNSGATASDVVNLIVNPAIIPSNKAPVSNAGNDINITLPQNSVSLNGSGTDSDGTITTYAWTKVSGPAAFSIGSPQSAQTTISGLVEGVYEFQLMVTDNAGGTATDLVQVIVNPAPAPQNTLPIANAGSDITILLPKQTIILAGSGNDPDGSIVGYSWRKVSGPAQYNIVNASSAQTIVNDLSLGVYEFELTVTDNSGATASDRITVMVNRAPNAPPVAMAGDDFTIKASGANINLDGSGSYDSDGSIVTYSWTKLSGPDPYTMLNPNTPTPALKVATAGRYEFELTVTDNENASASDRISVLVLPANKAPKADPGKDTILAFPANSIELSADNSLDEDGTIVEYNWTQLSGPNKPGMNDATKSHTRVQGLVIGKYQYQLTVIDNEGASATSIVTVEVQNLFSYKEAVIIYPNPVKDRLNFMLFSDHAAKMNIQVVDINGRILHRSEVQAPGGPFTSSIDVRKLSKGVYAFQLHYPDGRIKSIKFIKK